MKKFHLLLIGVLVLPFANASHADITSDVAQLITQYDGIRNDKTALGVTDGNPLAATSFMARASYDSYGLYPRVSAKPKTSDNNWIFDMSAGAGAFDGGDIDGSYATAELGLAYRFNDTVALSVILPVEYRRSEHTDTYIAGIELGLPIVLMPDHDDGFSWILTPSIMGTGAGISINLAQGGYLFGGGLTSSLAWQSNALTLVMANQITYAWGFPIIYDDSYALRQNISQPILKNGFGADYALNESWLLDTNVSYTNLLNRAFTDNYWTFGAGVSYLFSPDTGIRVGVQSDYADNFKTYGADLQFFISY